MDHPRDILTLTLLLATVGCGPPRIGSGPSEGETGSDPTSSSSESGSTESTTEEPSETETSGPSSTSGPFIPDQGMKYEECSQWEQDCPEGEKCVPYGSTGGNWDAHKCVPLMGARGPGEPCWYGGTAEATDNCDETSMCWDVKNIDGELLGICRAFCFGSEDNPQCPPFSSCLIGGSTIALCIPDCHPLVQDCGPGLACFWAVHNFWCIFTTQDIPAGEPCGYINDCALGLSCLDAEVIPDCEGSACCSPFCDINLGDAQCEAVPGTVCVPFFEAGMAPPDYEDVGVCIAP